MIRLLDPRPSILADRLAGIKNIVAVTGFKGGVGKSGISCALSLALTEKGFKTGLFDLDFSGASDHLILGAGKAFPREEKGLLPPYVHGVKFMTAAYFSSGRAIALRGASVSDAIKELFTVTIWADLDYLVVDMPPGIGDAAFEIMKFMPRALVLPVETPCELSKDVLNRSLEVYKQGGFKIPGIVQNMAVSKKKGFYSQVFYDPAWPKAVGKADKLIKTSFYSDVFKLAGKLARESSLCK